MRCSISLATTTITTITTSETTEIFRQLYTGNIQMSLISWNKKIACPLNTIEFFLSVRKIYMHFLYFHLFISLLYPIAKYLKWFLTVETIKNSVTYSFEQFELIHKRIQGKSGKILDENRKIIPNCLRINKLRMWISWFNDVSLNILQSYLNINSYQIFEI